MLPKGGLIYEGRSTAVKESTISSGRTRTPIVEKTKTTVCLTQVKAHPLLHWQIRRFTESDSKLEPRPEAKDLS